jgi:hypothetical protein
MDADHRACLTFPMQTDPCWYLMSNLNEPFNFQNSNITFLISYFELKIFLGYWQVARSVFLRPRLVLHGQSAKAVRCS